MDCAPVLTDRPHQDEVEPSGSSKVVLISPYSDLDLGSGLGVRRGQLVQVDIWKVCGARGTPCKANIIILCI
jgi:hypothetical protein